MSLISVSNNSANKSPQTPLQPPNIHSPGGNNPNTPNIYGMQRPPGPINNESNLLSVVLRRKFVVILLGLVGAGVGYLHYINEPNQYQSKLHLMVTTQTPSIGNLGDVAFQQSSLGRFAKLASSDIVFSKAASSNHKTLSKLTTFREAPSIGSWMKENVSVSTNEKSGSDVLTLSAVGPDADELPTILNSVSSAFQSVIFDDNKEAGEKSVELLKELIKKTVNKHEKDKQTQKKLLEKLSFATRDSMGNFENPYQPRFKKYQAEVQRLEEQIKEQTLRLNRLNDSLKIKSKTGIQLAVMEARKFFDLGQATQQNTIQEKIDNSSLEAEIKSLEEKVFAEKSEIKKLLIQRRDLLRRLGKKNQKVRSIDLDIRFRESVLNRWEQKKKEAETKLAEKNNIDPDILNSESAEPSEDDRLLSLYKLSLNRSLQNAKQDYSKVNKDFLEVEKQFQAVATDIFSLRILEDELKKQSTEIETNLEKMSQLSVISNKFNVTKIREINPAEVGKKISPLLTKSIGVGVMLGALCGVGLAFLTDKAEAIFRSPQEILDKLALPVVGRIPRVPVGKIKGIRGNPALVAKHKPASRAAEAFRAIRTSIFFVNTTQRNRIIMFTSPSPGDGKSTVAANVAISLATSGKRVCLIDADFRRPRVHSYFDEKNSPGVLGILSGETEIEDALQESFQDGLLLLPSGGRPGSPGDVVTSPEFGNLVEKISEQFDFVIIDTPPVLPVADAMVISNYVDAIYVVMRIRKGVKLTAQKTKESLEAVDANIIGVIVNCVDDNPNYNEYGYAYAYGYGNYSFNYGGYYDNKATVERERVKNLK